MNAISLLKLLKQQSVLREAKLASMKVQRVFAECFQSEDEDVLIITDSGSPGRMLSPLLAAGYFFAAKSAGHHPTLFFQGQKSKGESAESHIEEALDDSGYENIVIVIANSLGSLSHGRSGLRKFAASRRHKFISCTGLSSLTTGKLLPVLQTIDTDYEMMRKRGYFLKDTLDKGKQMHITTPAGTDLWIEMSRRGTIANDGYFGFFGKGGNIPAGEVYGAPQERGVEGKMVIDGSSRNMKGTVLIREPITLTIEDGEVMNIEGGVEAKMLEKSLEWASEKNRDAEVRMIAEFGIGINPHAKMIGAMIVDEKTQNTAHIAMGSNHWFGGGVESNIHLDQLIKNPSIWIDGELLDKKLYAASDRIRKQDFLF